MENKYDRGFWKFEEQYKHSARLINEELKKQYCLKNDNEHFEGDYLSSICLNFHLYSTELKRWVIKNVIPCFTNETLTSCYLMELTDALMLQDKSKIAAIMTSFKQIGLIKDIELYHNKIILVTNNYKVIKLKNLFSDKKVRDKFKSKCHSGCEFLINNEENLKDGSYIITIKDSFIGKKPIYHSVLLSQKGYIIDPARNIIMKLEDYKQLLKPHVIMCMSREEMLEKIENLKQTDEQFNNSNLNNVLKLVINRQIKHN